VQSNRFELDVTPDEIEKFLAVHGTKGVKTLSVLGKDRHFMLAIRSEIGQELLRDLMAIMEHKLNKIIELKASELEKAEYTAYRKLFFSWVGKIKRFEKNRAKIKEV